MGTKGLAFIPIILAPILSTNTFFVDRASTPKFLLLLAWSLVVICIFPRHSLVKLRKHDLSLFLLLVTMIFGIASNFIVHGRDINKLFFGSYSRYNGGLTLLVLLSIMFFFYLNSSLKYLDDVLFPLFGVSFALAIVFGFFQYLENKITPVVLTLGNSNFASSFLGCATIFFFCKALENKSRVSRSTSAVFFCVGLFSTFQTDSLQGLVMIFLGILSFFIFKGKSSLTKKRILAPLLVTFPLTGSLLLGLLALNANFPFLSTLKIRMDYWFAGLKMFLSSIQSGVGLGNYGDEYRFFRSIEAATSRPQVVSDSAHNVFIQYLAEGGLWLFMPFLSITLLTLFRLQNSANRSSGASFNKRVIAALYIACLAEMLISIQNFGSTLIFWTLSGIILSQVLDSNAPVKKSGLMTQVATKENRLLSEYLGLLIITFLALFPSINLAMKDHKFAASLVKGDTTSMIESALVYPHLEYHLIRAADIQLSRGDFQNSKILAERVLLEHAMSFDANLLLALNPNTNELLRQKYLLRLREMDPLNPQLANMEWIDSLMSRLAPSSSRLGK